jgi:hypothetical protein
MIIIGSAPDDLKARVNRMLLPGETILAELRVQSPRPAFCVATPGRIIYVGAEQIGYRMGSIPLEKVTAVDLMRQRHVSTVHVMHSTGKLVLTSADGGRIQRFANVLKKQLALQELSLPNRAQPGRGAVVV